MNLGGVCTQLLKDNLCLVERQFLMHDMLKVELFNLAYNITMTYCYHSGSELFVTSSHL